MYKATCRGRSLGSAPLYHHNTAPYDTLTACNVEIPIKTKVSMDRYRDRQHGDNKQTIWCHEAANVSAVYSGGVLRPGGSP